MIIFSKVEKSVEREAMTYFKVLHLGSYLEGLKKTMKNLS